MKHPNTLYSRLALITSVTLITGYLIVSAVWTDMGSVGAGDQLSANLWNTFVDNLNDLDNRLKSTASTWPTVAGGIAYTGGNVGIGTVSPANKLIVIKDSLYSSAAMNAGLALQSEAGSSYNVGLHLGTDATTGISYIQSDNFGSYSSKALILQPMGGSVGIGTPNPGGYRTAIRGSTDDSTAGSLWVSGLTAGTPGLMVRNDGNVGIGTATPGKKLDVAGHIRWGTSGEGVLTYDGTNTYIDAALAGGATNFRNSIGTVVMKLQSDGKVGIGTTNPKASLHTFQITGNGPAFLTSTSDLLWGSIGSIFQIEFGAASGNTYTKLESFIGGGSAYGDLALNPGGGSVVVGPYEVGGSKLKVIQPAVGAWTALIRNTSATVGENYGLTIRAGTNSTDTSFDIMDKTSTNYYLRVRGDGNIGIGTNTPGTRLHVVGAGEMVRIENTNTAANSIAQIAILASGAGNYIWSNNNNSPGYYGGSSALNIYTGQASPIAFFTNSTERMRIDGTGNVGIGTTASTGVKFYVKGNGSTTATYPFMVVNSSGTNLLYVNDGGGGYLGAAAWSYLSDRRLKEKITPLSYGIKEIMKLDAKKFDYIKGEKNNLGFIAQDVQSILPELVTTQPSGILGLKTDMIIPVLVKAMQELKKENDTLKTRIENLEKK